MCVYFLRLRGEDFGYYILSCTSFLLVSNVEMKVLPSAVDLLLIFAMILASPSWKFFSKRKEEETNSFQDLAL